MAGLIELNVNQIIQQRRLGLFFLAVLGVRGGKKKLEWVSIN
jgi:hypothetical protein